MGKGLCAKFGMYFIRPTACDIECVEANQSNNVESDREEKIDLAFITNWNNLREIHITVWLSKSDK